MKEINYVTILLKCPMPIHAEIEELCINEGISLSDYFMRLHTNKKSIDTVQQAVEEEAKTILDDNQKLKRVRK